MNKYSNNFLRDRQDSVNSAGEVRPIAEKGGSHDEVTEWPNCDEKTNIPGETNQ
jgi:hypothetical protein